MILLWIYLGVGMCNAGWGMMRGHFPVNAQSHPVELFVGPLFYLLLWPLQLLFQILVGIHTVTGWVLEKLFA